MSGVQSPALCVNTLIRKDFQPFGSPYIVEPSGISTAVDTGEFLTCQAMVTYEE